MVVPVARHPVNKNGIVVFDLRFDPAPLLELEADELRERLFTPVADLPDGVERIPLKTVHINKCPVLVPMSTLEPGRARRWQIDVALGEQRCRMLRGNAALAAKVQQVFGGQRFEAVTDPDLSLYGGGFFSDSDRAKMARLRSSTPDQLARLHVGFDDPRIPEMLFRYRGRNYPEWLSDDERARWNGYCRSRLVDPEGGGSITLSDYRLRIAELRQQPGLDPDKQALLGELDAYADTLSSRLGL
jgi:exodeoxyribonuclease-1